MEIAPLKKLVTEYGKLGNWAKVRTFGEMATFIDPQDMEILMGLGRWGTKSMGRLPADVATRSRWLVAAMLAFHDETKRVARPTTWELRLTDGAFTVRAKSTDLTVTAGAPDDADLVITTEDEQLHRLLTHRLDPAGAVGTGAVTVEGAVSELPHLIDLFSFPDIDPTGAD